MNYQRSKFLAEEEVRKVIARGLDAVILNPAAIMGPYDTVNWVRMIRLVCARKQPGVPPGRMSFCHVDKVARAHIAAVERGRRGENYLLGAPKRRWRNWCASLGRWPGWRRPRA